MQTVKHCIQIRSSCMVEILYEKFTKKGLIDLSKSGLIVYGGIKHCIAQHGYNYMSKNDELSFLDSYFRHLYRIVKFVDECAVLDRKDRNQYAERYKYICFLRAQLTDYELGLLFYNCLSVNVITKFKPLAERYALFNNLRDKMLNNPIKDRKQYADGAFEFQYNKNNE